MRHKAVMVAIATSSGLYLVGQLCPAVTMLGLRIVPSRYTWWSDMALYTAARTYKESLVPLVFSSSFPPCVTFFSSIIRLHSHEVCKKKEIHLLSYVLAAFQVMVSIRQNLRLYDGHNAMLAKKA